MLENCFIPNIFRLHQYNIILDNNFTKWMTTSVNKITFFTVQYILSSEKANCVLDIQRKNCKIPCIWMRARCVTSPSRFSPVTVRLQARICKCCGLSRFHSFTFCKNIRKKLICRPNRNDLADFASVHSVPGYIQIINF